MAMEGADISLPAMSPRISFSHDFIHNEPIPVEQRPPNHSRSPFSSTSFDFDFCIRECPDQESSSADEIFSHGKILPLQIKTKSEVEPPHRDPSPSPPLALDAKKPRLKKLDPHKQGGCGGSNSNSNSKSSFWHFKRSTSCGSAYTRSLCPLPLLSRSNSTGSTPKRTPLPLPKDKQISSLRNNNNNNNASKTPYHKPPLKKLHANNLHGGGLQVNPILNLHSGNLFGLASIFSSSPRDRTTNKK